MIRLVCYSEKAELNDTLKDLALRYRSGCVCFSQHDCHFFS